MSAPDHYQAIVIGSGQGGTPLSIALAGAGLRTALVERSHIGGTCINEGCTPTKTMVASGRVAYLARRGKEFGVNTGDIRIDMARVRQRKRDIVDSFRNGSQKRLEKTANLDVIFGEASFAGPKSLSVRVRDGAQRTLSADRIFINAGARPTVPKLDGLKDVPFLDSTSIMELDCVPEHLLVLDGIEVLLKTKAESAAKSGAQIQLTVRAGNESRNLVGSHLLVATGRTPNTDSLNVGAAGIATDARGFVKVNGKLEANVEGVYARGDINGGPAFTHISYDDFRILRTNLIEKGSATTEHRFVPYTVFIDPQLGRVGITETQARARNKKFRVAKMPMNYVARALEVDETRGFMKAIVDAESSQILGAAVLGIEGGEIMAMLQLAMMGRLPFTALREAVFAHPTLAESLNNLFAHFA